MDRKLFLTVFSGGSPRIVLSASSFAAASAQGTDIGTLSVRGGKGDYTFTVTDTASDKVQLNGADNTLLEAGSASASAGAFSITIQAEGATTWTQNFTLTAVSAYTPSLDFSDSRNSGFLPIAA